MNFVDTIDLSQGADPNATNNTDPTPAFSSHIARRDPTLSQFIPPSVALVPLSQFQMLESQMATLIHHIHPWMQKSIGETEINIEKWDVMLAKHQIQ